MSSTIDKKTITQTIPSSSSSLSDTSSIQSPSLPAFLTSSEVVIIHPDSQRKDGTLIKKKQDDDNKSLIHSSLNTSSLPSHLQPIPPPPAAQPLEEDEYISALDKIIKRDFFPDLERLQRQNQDLDAFISGSNQYRASNQSIRFATDTPGPLAGMMDTPMMRGAGATPIVRNNQALDTPNPYQHQGQGHRATSTASQPIQNQEKDTYDTELSLDAFQSRYTSEDNASFAQILEAQNQAKRERFAWMYHTEVNEKRKLLKASSEMSDEEQQKEKARLRIAQGPTNDAKRIETWSYKSKNAVMFGPEGAPLTLADIQSKSRGEPKSITHNATRFETDPFSAKNSEDHASDTSSSIFHLDGTQKQNYNYIPMTPLLAPNQDVDPSELMTWGSIEGTPMLVESASSSRSGRRQETGPTFHMPETPRRESVAHRLSDKATKALRKRVEMSSGGGGSSSSLGGIHKKHQSTTPLMTPVGRTTTPSRGTTPLSSFQHQQQRGFSPAAQRLLIRTGTGGGGGLGLKKSRLGTASPFTILGGRSGGTATPDSVKSLSTSNRLPDVDLQLRSTYKTSIPSNMTPDLIKKSSIMASSSTRSTTSLDPETTSSSITDNLLNL